MLQDALQKKGNVNLYFMVQDEETGLTLNLLSHAQSIEVTNELADFLYKNENMVSFTLNDDKWKQRRKKEEVVEQSDEEMESQMPADAIDYDD